MKSLFKDSYPFEYRRSLGEKFRQKFPGKLPVIVERSPTSRIGTDEVKKYVIPNSLNFGHLYYLVRSHLRLRPEEAVILFVNDVIPASGSTLGSIYESYHDDDLFLYVVYQDESVYGGREDLPPDEKSEESSDNPDGEDNQVNHGNAEGGPPPPPPASTGGDGHDLTNGNPVPAISVFPPAGNSSAAVGAMGGASNAPSISGGNLSGIGHPLQLLADNANSLANIIAQFYIANRNLVQTMQLQFGTDDEPTPAGPQMEPGVVAGTQPLHNTPETTSNVVSSDDESEVPTEGNTSDLTTLSGGNVDTSRGPTEDSASITSAGGHSGDVHATAGGSGGHDAAAAQDPRRDAAAGGPSRGDAAAEGPRRDIAAGGPSRGDAAAESSRRDAAAAEGSRNATAVGSRYDATSEGLRGDDATSEGLRGDDATSEGLRGGDATSEGLRGSDATSEGLRGSDATSEGLRGGDATSEGLRGGDATSEGLRGGDDATSEGLRGDDDATSEGLRGDDDATSEGLRGDDAATSEGLRGDDATAGGPDAATAGEPGRDGATAGEPRRDDAATAGEPGRNDATAGAIGGPNRDAAAAAAGNPDRQ